MGQIFDLLFKSAEIVNFGPREKNEYIKDMTTKKDIANMIASAERRGEAAGREEKACQIATALLAKGMDSKEVSVITGLPLEQVQELRTGK